MAEAGPSVRAAPPRDFSDPYRTDGPPGLRAANLLSESQVVRLGDSVPAPLGFYRFTARVILFTIELLAGG
jgi:hypothetical protein